MQRTPLRLFITSYYSLYVLFFFQIIPYLWTFGLFSFLSDRVFQQITLCLRYLLVHFWDSFWEVGPLVQRVNTFLDIHRIITEYLVKFFQIIANMIGEKWYCSILLICIFCISEIELLSLDLKAIYISFLFYLR